VNYSGTDLEDMTYSYAGKNIFDEERLCQRYYEKLEGEIYASYGGSGNTWVAWQFKVNKRVAPPTSGYVGYDVNTSFSGNSVNHAQAYRGGAGYAGFMNGSYADAELS